MRGKTARYRRPYAVAPGGTRRRHPQVAALPRQTVCPACGLVQLLDADRLQLTDLPITIAPARRLMARRVSPDNCDIGLASSQIDLLNVPDMTADRAAGSRSGICMSWEALPGGNSK